jgi:preprotein translocase subunit SecF
MLRIIQNRAAGFIFSGTVTVLALAAWLLWGLKPGLDFTGGSLLEIEFVGAARPEASQVIDIVRKTVTEGEVAAQPLGEQAVVVRLPAVDEDKHQQMVAALKAEYEKDGATLDEKRFESIGPVIGQELQRKTIWAVLIAIVAIVLYITYVFRKVSHPIASWKYGVCTVAALLHDVILPIGALSALGHFTGLEIGAWVVTALLTVLGFSVHDTIVVFDRIREHLAKSHRENFEDLVNQSVNETLARSINTSLTVLLTLAAAYVFGGDSTKPFVLTMLIGIAAGTYSSIFVASPLLVTWHLHDQSRRRR